MLFLFNTSVLDLGQPDQLVGSGAVPISLEAARGLGPNAVLSLIREAVFDNPGITEASPGKAAGLAALLAVNCDANALLAVRPPRCKDADAVEIRVAHVSLLTMAHLARLSLTDPLSPETVDRAVWACAG